ncbi:I5P1 phosphatase, partial [Polypterus senegalus]
MNTRCPSWCDRVLMSHSAKVLIYRVKEECENNGLAYDTIGSNVCMGDHKVRNSLFCVYNCGDASMFNSFF